MQAAITSKIKAFHQAFPLYTYPAVYTPPDIPKIPILYIFPTTTTSKSCKVVIATHHPNVSLDLNCVKYQALIAFSNYTCQIRQTFKHDASPTGQLPFLLTPDGTVYGGRDIEKIIKQEAADLDLPLSDEDRADCRAFITLVESKITLAIMCSLWMNEENMTQFTSPLQSSFYVPTLGSWVTASLHSKVMTPILSRRPGLRRDQVYEEARVAISALSTRLGGSLYFFGTRPTTLDAVVFANLHIILSSKTPNDHLHAVLNKHENLLQYTRRVCNTFFVTSKNSDTSSNNS